MLIYPICSLLRLQHAVNMLPLSLRIKTYTYVILAQSVATAGYILKQYQTNALKNKYSLIPAKDVEKYGQCAICLGKFYHSGKG
ncbi:MAG: hypothetical protein VXZ72_01910, partial [Chlamydiota bacterium]|nr:hypothetical protein [Chlamydiota bacterium]